MRQVGHQYTSTGHKGHPRNPENDQRPAKRVVLVPKRAQGEAEGMTEAAKTEPKYLKMIAESRLFRRW